MMALVLMPSSRRFFCSPIFSDRDLQLIVLAAPPHRCASRTVRPTQAISTSRAAVLGSEYRAPKSYLRQE